MTTPTHGPHDGPHVQVFYSASSYDHGPVSNGLVENAKYSIHIQNIPKHVHHYCKTGCVALDCEFVDTYGAAVDLKPVCLFQEFKEYFLLFRAVNQPQEVFYYGQFPIVLNEIGSGPYISRSG